VTNIQVLLDELLVAAHQNATRPDMDRGPRIAQLCGLIREAAHEVPLPDHGAWWAALKAKLDVAAPGVVVTAPPVEAPKLAETQEFSAMPRRAP
jgi:hypothetical protein